jgi:diacylglycerol kinase family enzyme
MGRRTLVLVNPKSGLPWSFGVLRKAVSRSWESAGGGVYYQFSTSAEDGYAKARDAVKSGFDCVLVAGGDGTVNTVGRALMGTDVVLGVIPAGSGNGFARHFEIPLSPDRAVDALAGAQVVEIDVGLLGDLPFFVTASMAWDASIVRSFQRYPLRGVIPYVFAGVQELFEYQPQDMTVIVDGGMEIEYPAPMVFTVANLTQFGGGARIAPSAKPDDGQLELVVALRQDIPALVANLMRLFDGSIGKIPAVHIQRFKTLHVRRQREAAIQVDGELVRAPVEVDIRVRERALRVLVPESSARET